MRSARVHLSAEFALDGGGIFSRWMGQIGERCVLPMPPPHPAPNARLIMEVSAARGGEQREERARGGLCTAGVGSIPPTYSPNDALNLSHAHTHSHKSIRITVLCNYTVRSHTLPLAEPQSAHDPVLSW